MVEVDKELPKSLGGVAIVVGVFGFCQFCHQYRFVVYVVFLDLAWYVE